MSEIAFNQHGERVQLHERTVEILIRRFKNPGKPGGPEKVVGPNGLPLYVPRVIKMDEFLGAVRHVPGRYRGDQVDELRRLIEGAEPLYIDVMDQEPARHERDGDARDHVIAELARANADAIKTMADRLSGIMDSAAHVIRACDGAQLPQREPVAAAPAAPPAAPAAPTPEPHAPAPPSPTSPMAQMVMGVLGQAGPLINHIILTRVVGLPADKALQLSGLNNLTGPLGGGAATTPAPDAAPPGAASPAAAGATSTSPAAPVDFITQINAVERLLTPHELGIVMNRITRMPSDALDAWKKRITAVSAADAAAMIRVEIAAQGGVS